MIVSVAMCVAGVTAYVQKLLEIRKLRAEYKEARRRSEAEESRIVRPTTAEVERFAGKSIRTLPIPPDESPAPATGSRWERLESWEELVTDITLLTVKLFFLLFLIAVFYVIVS